MHEDERILEDHLDKLGNYKITAIDRKMVARLHADMSKTPIIANRTIALLSKMMNLAEAWGYRPDHTNPCRHVERYHENKRKRYLTDDELSQLGTVLQAEEAKHPAAVLAVRLLLLSGMRLNEVLALSWDVVDLQDGVIHLTDSKTGEKDVVLGAAALQLLVDAPKKSDGRFHPPGARGAMSST